MKKISKLQINSDRLMKDVELTTLKGGYGGECCVCLNGFGDVMGYMGAPNQTLCDYFCGLCGWTGTYGPWDYC